MSDIDPKAPEAPAAPEKPKPIPREEPPADPSQFGPAMDPMLRLMERMNVKLDGVVTTQTTQSSVLEGMRQGLTTVQGGLVEVVTRVEKLEKNAPGSNPPPRTESKFIAAVDARAKAISSTTESVPDKATAAQVVALQADVKAIKAEMGLQTKMLGTLVDGLGSFARNPTVRKIAYVAGGLFLGWLTHLAAQKGFQFP